MVKKIHVGTREIKEKKSCRRRKNYSKIPNDERKMISIHICILLRTNGNFAEA